MQNQENEHKNRREFIKKGALAAAAFYIVPRHVLGKGFTAPSDKLNIASIGCGGKGWSDTLNAWNNDKENIVALCDVDFNRAKQAVEKWPKATRYKDFREMLDKEKNNIDAVTVSTPDHNHAVAAMAAMQLGKHVYVQKPLTHDIYEARMLTEAARKYKVVTQMGNQGASGDGVQQMIKWFDAGLIGTVSTIHVWTNRPVWPQGIPVPKGKHEIPADMNWDGWLGTAPTTDFIKDVYHPFKWRGWWAYGTGALGDMACHLIDPAYRTVGLGYPTAVECSVGATFLQDWVPEYIPEGCPPASNVQLKFAASAKNKSEVTLNWMDGGIRPFHPDLIPADEPLAEADSANGVILIGSKGIMTCGTYGLNPKMYFGKKKVSEDELAKYKYEPKNAKLPENGHQQHWTKACKAGFDSAEHKELTSSFDFAGPLTESVLMGNLAIRSYMIRQGEGRTAKFPGRKKLLWDGVNMKITNFDEANQFVQRKYRDGWSLGI